MQAGGEQQGDRLGKRNFGNFSYMALAFLSKAFPHSALLASHFIQLLAEQ